MIEIVHELMTRTLSHVTEIGLGRITMEEMELLNLKEVSLVVILVLLVYSSFNEAVNKDCDM